MTVSSSSLSSTNPPDEHELAFHADSSLGLPQNGLGPTLIPSLTSSGAGFDLGHLRFELNQNHFRQLLSQKRERT